MSYRDKLEAWLDDPNTPPEAWMVLPFLQIDKEAGVKPENACKQIPRILAKRMDKSEKEVRDMRMEYRRRHGLA